MKRLPEIFIFLLSFAYTDSLDTDVSHVIVDHKGNSIIALVDSMDLNTVYYTNKSDNKASTIDIDKVYFIYNASKEMTYSTVEIIGNSNQEIFIFLVIKFLNYMI